MTALDVTLTPAQWEHYDQHGWTLTEAPTPVQLPDAAGAYPVGPAAPVPATVPCPECNGSGQARIGDLMAYLPPCRHCDGSGVVPRTVGIIRPEQVCPACGGMRDVAAADEPNPMPCARCKGLGHFPAERVGTATVTPVPVVDVGDAPPDVPHVVVSVVTGTVWWCGGKRVESGRGSTVWTDVQQVQVLFATPPNPGTTVWRLDRNEER